MQNILADFVAQDAQALVFTQAAPDSVRFLHAKSVGSALLNDGTSCADGLCSVLPVASTRPALAVRMKEHL